ncbi:MAG: leucyl aminopeptidase [Thermodesulfovibrionales bacterium]|nr:leucyl aminopeptidase [Thermodesulfovibrionales bacterium]
MNVSIKNIRDRDYRCDALILPFCEEDAGDYKSIGPSASSLIRKIFRKEFSGKQHELLLVPSPADFKPERFLLVGIGKRDEVSPEKVRQAGGKAASYAQNLGLRNIALSTEVLSSLKISPAAFLEGALLGTYKFRKYHTENDKKPLSHITILSKASRGLLDEVRSVQVVSSSVLFARDLINTPANDMTPSHLASVARSLRGKNLSVKILEKRDAAKLGMGAYLSVAKGSEEPPKFIILHYRGTTKKPLVLIGKSITFDSGGLSLKPAEGMEKMKYDMAGGAAVLGVFRAVSQLKLPVHLIGILPATENLPGGSATKPGDVIRSIGGKTIEIVNTDAEGRMTLADALGYAQRFRPYAMIDIATLTGACAIALGQGAVAMMGNDKELMDTIRKAGHMTYERVWEMPLFDEYREYIKSDIADLKNTGGRAGSLSTSAYFLKEFAGEIPWVHLDIAGTAWSEKDRPYVPKGAAGIGVRLLTNVIRESI